MNLKAVLLDYTGTMVQESGKELEQMIHMFCTNSDMHDPKQVIAYVWKMVKKLEKNSYREEFMTEDQIVDIILQTCKNEVNLNADLKKMHELWRKYWVNAPLFDDVKEFFEKCPYPIYVITNDGMKYMEESMRIKGLNPAGVISGDMVRAYKPHVEIFEKALEASGCKANEVVHIGDSMESDVSGAREAKITPILLDRNHKAECNDILVAHSLAEVLKIIR